MALLFLLLSTATAVDLPRIGAEESTPSSLLRPRNFNHHAHLRQYLEESFPEVTTKKGPVLFPNDAPPPPRRPLIVTSRPLIESIARSELNRSPELNNSIAESSQIKPEFRLRPDYIKPEFRLKPEYLRPAFLAKVRDYKPFVMSTPAPADYGSYAGGAEGRFGVEERYSDYDDHSSLPPIYKAIADAAKQKVLDLQIKKPLQAHFDHQEQEPKYARQYQHNDVRDDIDYDHNSNYAFSYTVKDHKTGDDFSHSQHSTGSATNGQYRVRLPDGRMQIVSYTADENGYKADVRYDDEDKTAGNSINYDYRNDYGTNRHDYTTPKPDYGAGKHDYGANKHGYNANLRDYNANRPDYVSNRYDNGANVHDYGANRPNHQNRHDYLNNQDYVQNRNYITKAPPVKEDYNQYSDLSKEYYNTDYSSLEYDEKDDNYSPHRSKFSSFIPKGSNLGTIVVPSNQPHSTVSSSTVRPSYEELKPLFVTKNHFNNHPTQNYLKDIELSVPSTTPSSINYEGTTEHVVIIGTTKSPYRYTNIRNVPLSATQSPVAVTPESYLVSTIAGLKNGQKPVLSGRFIDKINKYLTFT